MPTCPHCDTYIRRSRGNNFKRHTTSCAKRPPIRDIQAARAEGQYWNQIAQTYKVSTTTIRRWAEEIIVVEPLDQDYIIRRELDIMQSIDAGETWISISTRYGVLPETIKRWVGFAYNKREVKKPSKEILALSPFYRMTSCKKCPLNGKLCFKIQKQIENTLCTIFDEDDLEYYKRIGLDLPKYIQDVKDYLGNNGGSGS